MAAGADEQAHAEQADEEAGNASERQPDPEEDTVEHGHEERDARNDQRSDSGADAQLGPGDAAGVDDEQEAAHDRRSTPLAPVRPLGRLAAAR